MGAQKLRRAALAAGAVIALAACGPHTAVTGGLGSVDYHGEAGARLTPFVGARVGLPEKGVHGVLAADLQPIPVPASGSYNVSTLYVVPSLQVALGPVALRGGPGFILNLYSSDQGGGAGHGNPAGGLALSGSLSTRLPPRAGARWGVEVFTTTLAEPSRREDATIIAAQLVRYIR